MHSGQLVLLVPLRDILLHVVDDLGEFLEVAADQLDSFFAEEDVVVALAILALLDVQAGVAARSPGFGDSSVRIVPT